MLEYFNYDNINIDEELEKISSAQEVSIKIEPTNKKCLFLLGILFASGKKIIINNEDELNLTETKKSFSIMPYVWSKLGDFNFPNSTFSNVNTEMDKRIENIKRLGVRVNPIMNEPIEDKIFLICPVRNANNETKNWIENYVLQKERENIIIHDPHLHTIQEDLFGGYTICLQNATAVATSSEVDLYYDQTSTGSVFDLGVAYYLNKPLVILNTFEIKYNKENFIDEIILNWPYKKKIKKMIKTN